MKVRALAILNTPDGTKEVGDTYEVAADKAQELIDLGWVEKADAKTKPADADAKV